ncbi:unnamed protein product [Cochlearia groenlandica]
MFVIFCILLLNFSSDSYGGNYIVHMNNTGMIVNISLWHEASVRAISHSAQVIYSYRHAIEGFAARLTPEEAKSLLLQPGVISVFPEVSYTLDTTRSSLFLGLEDGQEHFGGNASANDVIVGIIDTGVWPESKSFNDQGFNPPPTSWKGVCQEGTNFTASMCNNKLVGARYFSKGFEADNGPIKEASDFKSPRDSNGHGTHTSSTVVGSYVRGVTSLGYAPGVARGVSPTARVAMYKVGWYNDYVDDWHAQSSDILAAIDKAIEDNVDVLSLSIGLGPLEYHSDSVAIGTLAAIEKGIFVSASAGNDGPHASTLHNVAPWITTVGAGTIDREFRAIIKLGDGKSFTGFSSLFKQRLHGFPAKPIPLVYGSGGGNITGKCVLVDMTMYMGLGTSSEEIIKPTFGIPLVTINANTVFDGYEIVAEYNMYPSLSVGKLTGDKIRYYVKKDPNPTVTIEFKGTVVNVRPAPVVAGFSSRGPNSITPIILKPDLIAPGVNILAARTGAKRAGSGLEESEDFVIETGTSMSCPHVSGIAALLIAAHPEWSPAAIRSALMTTASGSGNDGKPILDVATGKASTPFAHGAGHVSPVSALNPGLIYDLTADDYLDFLCASNYTWRQIKTVARREFECDPKKSYRIADLNYPSFAVTIGQSGGAYTYTRVVTSVGGAGAYSAKVFCDKSAVNISVEPAVLSFKEVNEKKSYTVTFTVNRSMPKGTNSFASIEWSDGRHVVRSPVALTWS